MLSLERRLTNRFSAGFLTTPLLRGSAFFFDAGFFLLGLALPSAGLRRPGIRALAFRSGLRAASLEPTWLINMMEQSSLERGASVVRMKDSRELRQ